MSLVPRRDGMLLQVTGENDYYGYGDETTVAERSEAEHAVTTIASLFPTAVAGSQPVSGLQLVIQWQSITTINARIAEDTS